MNGKKTRAPNSRRMLTTVAAGAAFGLYANKTVSAQSEASFTPQEKANLQVIDDFIAAWNAKDATKVMSFFAEDARFAVGEIGKTPSFSKPNFAGLISGAQSISMVVTPGTKWARGPVVTHEREDKIVLGAGGPLRQIAGKYIAVFTLRDQKIVDFIDFEFWRPGQA